MDEYQLQKPDHPMKLKFETEKGAEALSRTSHCTDEQKAGYERFLKGPCLDWYGFWRLRSFVEDNRQLTWCPSPGCEHAVEARVEVGADPMDIVCKCGATFCFQCKEEAHRPVSHFLPPWKFLVYWTESTESGYGSCVLIGEMHYKTSIALSTLLSG